MKKTPNAQDMTKLTRTIALMSLVFLMLTGVEASAQTLCLSFVSFSASKSTNCSVSLAWTYNQCDTGRYYVEYSLNGSFFEPIAVVNQAGSIGSEQRYTYADNHANPGDPSYSRAYYRVRFTGDNGTSRYSPVVPVSMDTASYCERNNTNRRAVIREGIIIPNGYSSLKGDYTNLIPGDFNGDGRTDFIRQEKGAWDDEDAYTAEVFLSNGDGYFTVVTPNNASSLKGDYTNLIPGDFNGDGRTDFIRQEKGSWDDDNAGTAEVFFSNGNGYFTVVTPNNASSLKGDYTNLIPGDFNGDGRTDFIRQEKGAWDDEDAYTAEVCLSNGDGSFTVITPNNASSLKGDYTNLIPGDFNGDGRTDFIRQEKGAWDDEDAYTAEVFLSNGNGSFTVVTPNDASSLKGDYTNLIPGDFNGDGRTDFIRQEKGFWDDDDAGTAGVFLSNGNGSFTVVTPNDASSLKGDYTNLIPGDFNGDGRTDFIRQEKGFWDDDDAGTARIYLSKGNGSFSLVALNNAWSLKGDYTNLIPGDFNGDGRTDFIRQEKGSWDDDDDGTAEVFITGL